MKLTRSIRLRVWIGCGLLAGWLSVAAFWQAEPGWRGYPLSAWLDAQDTNWRFDEGDGRRSRFTDAEIVQALDGIGSAALPSLSQWLTAKPSWMKAWANRLLDRQSWCQFRFRDDREWRHLAEVGFLYYGPNAQPLLPELIELSRSQDTETRSLAYQAAFFTWPDREIFLPLAKRALRESDGGVRVMAAHWMINRFPADAEQIGLRERFPSQFADLEAVNVPNDEP